MKLEWKFWFLIIVCIYQVKGKSKPLTVSLSTKWKSVSYLLEASEFVAEDSIDAFWDYINEIVSSKDGTIEDSSFNHYHLAIKFANKVLGNQPNSLKESLLKLSLSVRNYSPRIEMHHQLASGVDQPSGCDIFFDINGKRSCEASDVLIFLNQIKKDENNKSITFPNDHIYPTGCILPRSVVVYADITKKSFQAAHTLMKQLSEKNHCCYVLRHFVQGQSEEKAILSGYGVELAIKSTEYKAIDDSNIKDDSATSASDEDSDLEIEGFDFSKLRAIHPDKSEELTSFRDHLIDSSEEMKPMKVWQLQDLSYQAAARVLAAPKDKQLEVLRDVSQNFPMRVRSLVKQPVPPEMKNEILSNRGSFNQLDLEIGQSGLLVNGMMLNLDELDMFEILDLLRHEVQLFGGLVDLGFEGQQIRQALALPIQVKGSGDGDYVLDLRDSSITWLNDIEKDRSYQNWPTNIHDLLRPAFPGTLRRIRKNMHHMVFVIDPKNPEMKYLMESSEVFWANSVPLRIGIVFLLDDSETSNGLEDPSVALYRVYNYVRDETDDNEIAFRFLISLYKSLPEDTDLSVKYIKKRLLKKFKSADFDEIVGSNSDYDEKRKLGRSFQQKSGLTKDVSVLMNGVLLSEDDYSTTNFEQAVLENIMQKTSFLQRSVYMGTVRNDDNVLDFLMDQPNVVPRFNSKILKQNKQTIDLTGIAQIESYSNVKKFEKLLAKHQTATIAEGLNELYLAKSDAQNHIRPLTVWVVVDLNCKKGRRLLYTALKFVKSSSQARIGIIHNPKDEINSQMIKYVESAISSQQATHARNFIIKLLKEENVQKLLSGEKTPADLFVNGMNEEAFEQLISKDSDKVLAHVSSQRSWTASVLGLKPGNSAVVYNGKVIGPLIDDERLVSYDFELIESLEYKGVTDVIKKFVKNTKSSLTTIQKSDLIMKLSSHLASANKVNHERLSPMSTASSQHSVINLKSSKTNAFDIVAVINPASNQAQHISPILEVLHEVLDANIQVFMNCQPKLSDLPVKRFYRFVLDSKPNFKSDKTFQGPHALFKDLPSKSLLTLTMHPPEGWMVEAVRAVHDLDNIRLNEVDANEVVADYELEHLVLEGHARDLTTGSPPRGLQFTLGADRENVSVDTIVMANLGYFQMKTTPGVWFLNLRKGRSEDIYNIISIDGQDSTDVPVVMDSFKSVVLTVKVAKKSEKVNEDLLEDKNEAGFEKEEESLWSSIANTFTGSKPESGTTTNSSSDDVINVFSLASGHLYERLMRIMMLSVIRHTKTRVKFWMLKNYLSPQFKDFISYMSKEYDFEFEMVQYKWPRWLNQQTEKQRTMWGYKILFLDVLFPLNVDKIIFVDADQIVRADLKELRDFDLEGNPYGYTPFCDDRKEMDGFRFWKGGYWANHLAGRKYHISAIYVVDLVKFRQIAAGDRLRGQYQALSQDPNSLANLDQDLPNNMIHQVGIKSLPQEWLWCSTWCSDESKSRAKTIDLCNNPLTKEPKLDAAVRIVSEWPEYDDEIKNLQSRWQKNLPNTNTSTKEVDASNVHVEL